MSQEDSVEEESLIETQKRLCTQFHIDFRKVEDLNSKIGSLIKQLKNQKESIVTISQVMERIGRNVDYWKDIWTLLTSKETSLNPRQKSLLELFLYLQLVEGIFSETVNAIAFILLENGHDVYTDIPEPKFVRKYEELRPISLFVRLLFLEEHGFNNLANAADRDLRNRIAHLDYEVKEDGTIQNTKTNTQITNLVEKGNYLGCICTVIMMAVVSALKVENPT